MRYIIAGNNNNKRRRSAGALEELWLICSAQKGKLFLGGRSAGSADGNVADLLQWKHMEMTEDLI